MAPTVEDRAGKIILRNEADPLLSEGTGWNDEEEEEGDNRSIAPLSLLGSDAGPEHPVSPTSNQANILQLAIRLARIEEILFKILPMVAISSQGQQKQLDALSKADLDNFCNELFQEAPEPGAMQLQRLTMAINTAMPHLTQQEVLPLVRRWFRKKREEVGIKVISQFKKICPRISADVRDFLLREMEADRFDFKALLVSSRVNMLPTTVVVSFCRGKVQSYLGKLRIRSDSGSSA